MSSPTKNSESSMVEGIRESMRQLSTANRTEKRQNTINQRRSILGEFSNDESLTPAFVTTMGTALKKKSLSPKDYGLLQNALIRSEEHIQAFLKVEGIMFALGRDLSSRNSNAQLGAANCCCNVALGNPKTCRSLTKHLAPYLSMELKSLNRPLVEVCAWTIANLISGGPKSFQILYAQNILQSLILLIADIDDDILPAIVHSIMQFIHYGWDEISESEIKNILQACLKRRNHMYQDFNYTWLLALLSSWSICREYLVEMIPSTVNYIFPSTPHDPANVLLLAAAIRILANMVCTSSHLLREMLCSHSETFKEECVIRIDSLLSSSQPRHIRKETLWLIGNFYNDSSLQCATKDFIGRSSSLKEAVDSMDRLNEFQLAQNKNDNV